MSRALLPPPRFLPRSDEKWCHAQEPYERLRGSGAFSSQTLGKQWKPSSNIRLEGQRKGAGHRFGFAVSRCSGTTRTQPVPLFKLLRHEINTSAENHPPSNWSQKRSQPRKTQWNTWALQWFIFIIILLFPLCIKALHSKYISPYSPSATLSAPAFTALGLQADFILSSHRSSSGCGFFRNRKSCAHAVQKDNEHTTELGPRKRLTSCGCLLHQNSRQRWPLNTSVLKEN